MLDTLIALATACAQATERDRTVEAVLTLRGIEIRARETGRHHTLQVPWDRVDLAPERLRDGVNLVLHRLAQEPRR